MANREKSGIRMEIDGVAYTLVLNTDVMATLEEYWSRPEKDVAWDEIWARVMRGSVRTVRSLIWAMLQANHPQITIAKASDLIDKAGGFVGLTSILSQAAKASQPDPTDVAELGVRPPVAPTGKPRRGTGGASTSTRAASA